MALRKCRSNAVPCNDSESETKFFKPPCESDLLKNVMDSYLAHATLFL